MNMTSPRFFFPLILLASFYFSSLPFGVTQQLPEDEVEALKGIATTLGKDWDSGINNPCGAQHGFNSCFDVNNETSVVICNCTYADGVCHVTHFVVEFNQLSGNLPSELGKLTQLISLQITSNNFSGELPATLANLKSLQEFRLGDNQFSGKIPDFIQNWTSLHTLIIQGSGLSGPIPSGISLLGSLTDLRISDLNGTENSSFPQLSNMTMDVLVLRSCNINGTLPRYLGAMTNLKTL